MKLLEKDVKKDFLTEQNLIRYDLGNLGKTTLLFEKVLIPDYLRADICLFTQNKGLIGIEIKNKHDNLKRLHRQLIGYVQTCNYVYVLCHKKHLAGVKKIIKSLNLTDTVGILVYSEFGNLIVPGLEVSAKPNKHFNLRKFLNVLWKSELNRIFISNYDQLVYAKSKYGIPIKRYRRAIKYLYPYNKYPLKSQIIERMIQVLGHKQSLKLACDMFIYHDQATDQDLQQHSFRDENK